MKHFNTYLKQTIMFYKLRAYVTFKIPCSRNLSTIGFFAANYEHKSFLFDKHKQDLIASNIHIDRKILKYLL